MRRGTIAIPRYAIQTGQSEFSLLIDFLWRELKKENPDALVMTLDWFAMKEEPDRVWFKWCDFSEKIPDQYLKSLEDDGWTLSIKAWTFQ